MEDKKQNDVDNAAQESQESSETDNENIVEEKKIKKINYRVRLEKMTDEELAILFTSKEDVATYTDALQRSNADYENYRKRQERDRSTFLKYSNQDILKKLIDVMGNFARAIDSVKEADVDKNFFDGICLVQKELEKTVLDSGVKEIKSKGQAFNPNYHEALSQVESPDHPEMTVIDEFEKGYLYHDRVLRPSKVIVSKKPQEENKAEEEKASDESSE